MTNLPYVVSARLQSLSGINHAFFTRQGGVSTGEFQSLNCSPYCGDSASSVQQNRQRIVAMLGAKSMVSLKQIHSTMVHCVDDHWQQDKTIEGDALVTKLPNIAIGVLGADCAPILLADNSNRVIGAAHGGWDGVLSGVTDTLLQAMCQQGAEVAKITAAIGPAIQRQSYEVGSDFKDRVFAESGFDCGAYFSAAQSRGKWLFDLPRYIENRLNCVGITVVDRLPQNTYTNPQRFFSYRRSCHQGKVESARQMSLIMLAGAN